MEKGTEGIVTSVKREGESTSYVVFDGEKYHRITSKKRIKGRFVRITGENIEELKKDIMEAVKRRFFRKISFDVELPEKISFLREPIERLWKEIAFLKITGDRPFVYFDPDADGIVSFLLISEVLRVNFRPLSPWHLETGNNLSPDLRSPFILLLDLGSTPDARPGVDLLRSLRPLFIVDHHYTSEAPPSVTLINPSVKDPSLSSYTTAILTSYLVKTWVEKPDWVKVAAAGDRSDVIKWSERDRKRALALEISTDVFGYNPSIWKQILDTDLWKPLWNLFEARIEKIEEISEKEEREVGGRKVLVIRYSSPGFYYPHRGKVASYYQEKYGYDVVIVEEVPKVKIYTVSVRGNVNFFPFVERAKELGIANGWGHPQAVTLKTEDPAKLEEELLRWMEDAGRSGKDDGGDTKEDRHT